MDRRAALKSLGILAASGGLASHCASRRARGVAPLRSGAIGIPRANVSFDRIIRTVVGLRPFRPSGFVVRADRLDEKVVIHNYGHGGGGVTLSWGTAHLAVEEVVRTGRTACAVIGSGAVGLATARLLQGRGFTTTIYAKSLPPDTTSNIAGATWFPSWVVDPDRRTPLFEEQFVRASRLSHRYFQDLVGGGYGVRWARQFFLAEAREPDSWEQNLLGDLFPETRRLAKGEHPFGSPEVIASMTMLIEPPVYLNALTRDFLLAGGRLVVREFADRRELLTLSEPVVVNCTGLGALALFGDDELTPIKGQLSVLIPQPEVDYILGAPDDIYMIPRADGIMLGGSHQRGEWTLEPDPAASRRILDGHLKVISDFRL